MTGATDPVASRPHMPGYGIEIGSAGQLEWPDVERRLASSRTYWLATTWPGGSRPHLMPVWALWLDGALWFSSSNRSRKVRNLDTEPRCSLATDDAVAPIIAEGRAERRTDLADRQAFLAAMNAKYEVDYDIDFLDPAVNATIRLDPDCVIALVEDEFTTSPTRFTFS